MADQNTCAFAHQILDRHPDPKRTRPPFGFCVHTSGRGVLAEAKKEGITPVEWALNYYASKAFSCHYFADYEGQLYQFTPDDRKVPSVGVEGWQRELFLSGKWSSDTRLNATTVSRWLERWYQQDKRFRSPTHLFPGPSANGVYINLELLPLPTVNEEGLLYTEAQHRLVAQLAIDLQKRHGWPAWPEHLPCPRLLGHEDLDAYDRWEKKSGGYDPGSLRARPWFSWQKVAGAMKGKPSFWSTWRAA